MTPRFAHASWILLAGMMVPVLAHAGPLAFPVPVLTANVPAAEALPPAAPTLPEEERHRWQTGLLRPDRLQHASLAMTSGLMIGVTTEEPALATAGAMTLGLAKEIIDIHDTGFDVTDLVADLIGALAAGFVTSAVIR